MLTTLKLYNFQAHAKRLIQFDPRITTIRGRTDVGKSAILRALRWLALNDTGGEEFVTWGAEEAVAIVELEDGAGGQAKIVRRKGRENVYKLDGQVFKAFGAGKVPEPVAAVLALSEINFQRQHDKPFWLDDPAGEVSRQLNRVIDLSVIDTAMSNAAKMVRTARERVSVSESRLEEKRTKETEAMNGTRRIERFRLLKAKYDTLAKIKSNLDQLEAIVRLADSVDVPALERRAAQAGVLVQKASELRNVNRAHSHLSGLIHGVEECNKAILEVPDIGPLSAKWIQLRQAQAQWELLNELVENALALDECIAADDLELKLMHERLFKHACPTCGRKNEK
jgi:exonuclease SbcC